MTAEPRPTDPTPLAERAAALVPKSFVVMIPFELMDREVAHAEYDAYFAEQARRAKRR